jgi:RNA polymerase sigma-70 factor (ECF subfamily)
LFATEDERYKGLTAMLPEEQGPKDPPRSDATAARADPLSALVPAASRGDARAMGDLLRAVAPHVRGAIATLSAGHQDDVLQECLIAFVRAVPDFRGESSVAHYARRIAVRTAVHLRRARAQRRRVDDDHAEQSQILSDGPDLPSHELRASRRRALVARLLEELPEVQAEALAFRVVLGYSLEEISAATSAPVNTVRTRMRLAREALRSRIENDPALAELAEDLS